MRQHTINNGPAKPCGHCGKAIELNEQMVIVTNATDERFYHSVCWGSILEERQRLGRWRCKWCDHEWPEYTTYHAMKARIRAKEIHPGKQCEPNGKEDHATE